MNTAEKITEIAFLMDRSGSMQRISESAVEGFNAFLERQRQEHTETPVRISLVLFHTQCDTPFTSVMAPDLPRLTMQSYRPDGRTALLDAIGKTIDETGVRLAATPQHERPGKVIIAILTDGLENASQNYTWEKVSDLIRHQSEVYKWEFLFLGANQDAIATAANLSINRRDAATFRASSEGIAYSLESVATCIQSKKRRMLSEDLSTTLQRVSTKTKQTTS